MYKVNFVVDRFLQERHSNGVNQQPGDSSQQFVNGVSASSNIASKYVVVLKNKGNGQLMVNIP